ncbi:MmcQ/YjbR family DNA-binding protein [Occallatibacter riparius]|uniref:MmcQ/YjbR family DNA-binding protein n=1 Tax=Occallatibacter riparius TaxID=1002689 RepID=A0A9J7BM60_9BACT|nr:MmcQ/YjbR family DNA-binding protein [Occallatibacter riparius]UWZ81998.1 MmcQ/YjbR family DNA-binding protein [Occallatibacter riparius]
MNYELRTAEHAMDANDFRRIALSLEGAEEGSHFGQADFRVGGRIFATLAAEKQGYGNLMLTPEQQAAFVAEAPEMFLAIPGGWGRNGATHVRLAAANEDVLLGALRSAWKLRIEKNQKVGRRSVSVKSANKTKAKK